ncbi:hypothetical protein Fmac_002005 [Flemingia macrophylla]|uniref:Late embryogenesis abundant protein LEA-2 subgroup domain-containing protein n=1 Tax=Flemingia macrophylla TaxID=520843 RepID=A0ABD1NLI6_9FABA
MMAKCMSNGEGEPRACNITTEELVAMYPSRKQEKKTSKCLVYTLACFVTLFSVWFVFASIVLRVADPEIEFRSASLMHSTNHYSVSSHSHTFNVTMIARVTLFNPNFGPFHFGDSTVSVLYGDSTVGASDLEGAKWSLDKPRNSVSSYT